MKQVRYTACVALRRHFAPHSISPLWIFFKPLHFNEIFNFKNQVVQFSENSSARSYLSFISAFPHFECKITWVERCETKPSSSFFLQEHHQHWHFWFKDECLILTPFVPFVPFVAFCVTFSCSVRGCEIAAKSYMSHLLLLGKFEYGGGPIFKVVLEC